MAANRSQLGIEMGLSGSLLVSDMSQDATGMGIGNQFSIYFTQKFGKTPIKFRVENVEFKSNVFTNADQLQRTISQEWWKIGAFYVVEKTDWYWEIGGGYSIGQDSLVQVEVETSDRVFVEDTYVSTRSFLFFGAGAGYRKNLKKNFKFLASLHTRFLLNSAYTGELEGDSFVPIPFMLSLGAEVDF